MTSRSFTVSGPLNLNCKFGAGSVSINAVPDLGEATVELVARDPGSTVLNRTTVELHGRTLSIQGPKTRGGVFDLPVFGRGKDADALDITVSIPAGSTIKVATMTGDVSTVGRIGDADIGCGASAVCLDEIQGNLRLRFGSGAIRVGTVSGSATVRGGSSEVQIGDGGSVDVAFGTGRLELGRAHGPVRMRTGAGSAQIGSAEADVDLTSGSGELAIGIPSGLRARLDIMTGSGQLRTEMPVEPKADEPGLKRHSTIRARTGSGDVTIRRAS